MKEYGDILYTPRPDGLDHALGEDLMFDHLSRIVQKAEGVEIKREDVRMNWIDVPWNEYIELWAIVPVHV